MGSRYGRRPDPTPDSNPNPNPNPNPNSNSNPTRDPKPQPKRAKTGHKRGSASFASNQEFSQLIADDDSEVQTALRIFQVKNTRKYPFSRVAKARRREEVLKNWDGRIVFLACISCRPCRQAVFASWQGPQPKTMQSISFSPDLSDNNLFPPPRFLAQPRLSPFFARFGCGLGSRLGLGPILTGTFIYFNFLFFFFLFSNSIYI